jgi:outer membrane protein assembly factor BamA
VSIRSLTFFLAASCLCAQVGTRTEQIEMARDRKKIEPDTPDKLEQRLIMIKDTKLLERLSAGIAGFRVKIGGMPTGSGFALGPSYLREDLADGKLVLSGDVQGSTRRWYKFQLGAFVPEFARGRMFMDASAAYHNYNSLAYYGPGKDSEKNDRTNYLLEDFTADVLLGVRPFKWARAGGSVGVQLPNVGQGRDSRYASTDVQFARNPRVVGLRDEPDFRRTGVFAELDARDNPLGARAGSYVSFRFDDYRGGDDSQVDFQRLDVEVQQYVPLFNKRRVIALRGRTVQSYSSARDLPFYQQAVLGGGNELRGFRPYRFHDNNSFLMNAEYRWEVFAGLDMALFADAGHVTRDRWEFRMADLETSVGFGFRFNVRNSPFLRLDVGFSHEGFQVFVKFNGPFARRPLASSVAPHLF